MDGLEDYDDDTVKLLGEKWLSIRRAANIQVILLSGAAILGICDLGFLATVPFIVTQTIERSWPFGSAICKISIAMTHASGIASGFFLGFLSISCYFAAAGTYSSFARKQWYRLFTVLSWIAGIIYAIPHLVLYDILEFQTPVETHVHCTLTSNSRSTSTSLHVTNAIIIIVPMLTSIIASAGTFLVNPTRLRMLELDGETRSGKTLLVALTANFAAWHLPFVVAQLIHFLTTNYNEKMVIASFLIMPLPFIESAISPLLYI
ncbi:hypothetical protein SK128_000547, partial [Halocaridina rubra]